MNRYDFVYRPADPDAYRELMESIGPSMAKSPSFLDQPEKLRKKKKHGGNGRMKYGTVKWFDVKKGYGYIAQDEKGAPDVFVHYSAINGEGFRTLNAGDRVKFDVKTADKGPRATNVSVVEFN